MTSSPSEARGKSLPRYLVSRTNVTFEKQGLMDLSFEAARSLGMNIPLVKSHDRVLRTLNHAMWARKTLLQRKVSLRHITWEDHERLKVTGVLPAFNKGKLVITNTQESLVLVRLIVSFLETYETLVRRVRSSIGRFHSQFLELVKRLRINADPYVVRTCSTIRRLRYS